MRALRGRRLHSNPVWAAPGLSWRSASSPMTAQKKGGGEVDSGTVLLRPFALPLASANKGAPHTGWPCSASLKLRVSTHPGIIDDILVQNTPYSLLAGPPLAGGSTLPTRAMRTRRDF